MVFGPCRLPMVFGPCRLAALIRAMLGLTLFDVLPGLLRPEVKKSSGVASFGFLQARVIHES